MPSVKGYPSVTEILSAVGLSRRYFGKANAEARTRGSVIHLAARYHGEGDLREQLEDFPPAMRPYWAGYLRFVEEMGHKALHSELELLDERLGVCGHLDRIGTIAGAGYWLIDFKTGNPELASVSLQLAGYRLLYDAVFPDTPIEGCLCLTLPGDGSYKVQEYDAAGRQLGGPAAQQTFLAAVLVYRAQKEINP